MEDPDAEGEAWLNAPLGSTELEPHSAPVYADMVPHPRQSYDLLQPEKPLKDRLMEAVLEAL